MATVRLGRLAGRSGGRSIRLVSLLGRSESSARVRLVSVFGRTASVEVINVDAGPDRTLEPMDWVDITATASTFVVWSIHQYLGPDIPLVGEGSSWRYRTPGTLTGVTLGWTITGTSTGGDPKRAAFLAILAGSETTATKVAYVGSSTTVGNNASTPGARYVNLLSAAFRTWAGAAGSTLALDGSAAPTTPGLHARNGGVSGATSATYVPAATHGFITTLQPQLVIHMIGSNDYGNSLDPATYKANVQTVIDAIDAEVTGPVLHILVNTYQRMDVTGSYAYATYGAKLAELANTNDNAMYVDLNPAYIAVGIPGADPLNYIDVDNLHQNDAGHAFMASTLFDLLVTNPPGTGTEDSDSVVHTIRAHGGLWSNNAGTKQARGFDRNDDLIPPTPPVGVI